MKNKIIFFSIALVICLLFGVCALGEQEVLRTPADPVFVEASTTLRTNKTVVFTAETFDDCSQICVQSVTLYRKNNSTNQWDYTLSLPVPSAVVYNTSQYGSTIDYSSQLVSGYTYKLYTVFRGGDHTMGRFSPVKSY